ncbi:hypothetical protein J7J83_02830 [bacterium]|nr:hypothetical protein [bacterium]
MTITEIIILGSILIACTTGIILYIKNQFTRENPCSDCPYSDICNKKS